MPLPTPTNKIPKIISKIDKTKFELYGNKYTNKSIVTAMIIAFETVPMPIFCFRGIHNIKILILTRKVANPILILKFFATPSANTVQGVTPKFETISKASPNPNNVNPKIRKNKVFRLGLILKGLSELHLTFGIWVILK